MSAQIRKMPAAEIASAPSNVTEYSSYKLLITSNIFFLVATICYLAAAALDTQDVKNAEQQNDKELSASWVALCLGALCFVVVGAVDYCNTKKGIHIALILAGIFGVVAAATSKSNVTASLVCNLLSAHLFLLESLQWIWGHCMRTKLDKNDSRQYSLLTAELGDAFFALGAMIDVVLSYIYLADKEQEEMINTQTSATTKGEVTSAILWFLAAVLTTIVSCRVGKQGFSGSSPATFSENTSATMT